MFQEFIAGGTLSNYLNHIQPLIQDFTGGSETQKVSDLCPQQAQCWTRHLLTGLYYLHSNGIVHHDLHQQNTMISLHGHIKFIDFGKAKYHQEVVGSESDGGSSRKRIKLDIPAELSEPLGKGPYYDDTYHVSQTIFRLAAKKRQYVTKLENPNSQDAFLQAMAKLWNYDPNYKPEVLRGLIDSDWLTEDDPLYIYHYSSKYGTF